MGEKHPHIYIVSKKILKKGRGISRKKGNDSEKTTLKLISLFWQ